MALPSSARPLLVPAADVLAKNMRALDAARVSPAEAASASGGAPHGTRRTLIDLGAAVEDETQQAGRAVRFRRAADDAPPSPIAVLLSKLFPKKLTDEEKAQQEARRKLEKTPFEKAMAKSMPVLEKAAALASRLPDPTVLFLALVLAVLLVERARPHWLAPVLVKIGVIASFTPLFILAVLWRKTELFAQLREGQNPLSHPAEHRLDDLEAQLTEREERVKKAEETLKKNRAQLDALRKELAKDPNSGNPEAVIVPSRKAAEMIAAGALGAGYDAEAAQAVEQKRKEESVKRSREEWKAKTEEADDHMEQTRERIKLMADHSASAYTKRTREIKTRTGPGGGALRAGSERLMSLRKVVNAGNRDDSQDSERRMSRQSELSGSRLSASASRGNSNASRTRKRHVLFRRKKRNTIASEDSVPAVAAEVGLTGQAEGEV